MTKKQRLVTVATLLLLAFVIHDFACWWTTNKQRNMSPLFDFEVVRVYPELSEDIPKAERESGLFAETWRPCYRESFWLGIVLPIALIGCALVVLLGGKGEKKNPADTAEEKNVPKIVSFLQKEIGTGTTEKKIAVLKTLGQLQSIKPTNEARNIFVNKLQDKTLRSNVILAIKDSGDRLLAKEVAKYLDDPNKKVRYDISGVHGLYHASSNGPVGRFGLTSHNYLISSSHGNTIAFVMVGTSQKSRPYEASP